MEQTFFLRRQGGFTLIELIVVIAILATLAAVAYPIILSAQNSARVAAASKTCTDLVGGVENFKQDHNGILPYYPKKAKPNVDDQIYLTTLPGKDAGLLGILTGYEGDDGEKLNLNEEAYIKPNKTEQKRDGLNGESADELGLYDPWGHPYYLVLCEMDDGCIDPFTEKRVSRTNCIVYSVGPDGRGVAPAHEERKATRAHRRKAGSGGRDRERTKAEARRAARDLRLRMEEYLEDNIYSWKKTTKK